MSPKLVDKDERKHTIATAALELFAEHGFEATSISQIAEAAGISKGTVYLYFDSKTELTVYAASTWVAAIEEGVAPLVDASQDPLMRLRTLLGASTQAFLQDRRMILLLLGVAQVILRDRSGLEHLDMLRRVSAPIRGAIREILLDGVTQGIFRPEVADDADRIAINLVAFVDGLGLHHATNPGFFDLPEQIDLYLVGLLDSLQVSSARGNV